MDAFLLQRFTDLLEAPLSSYSSRSEEEECQHRQHRHHHPQHHTRARARSPSVGGGVSADVACCRCFLGTTHPNVSHLCFLQTQPSPTYPRYLTLLSLSLSFKIKPSFHFQIFRRVLLSPECLSCLWSLTQMNPLGLEKKLDCQLGDRSSKR